jgi:NADPH-ferrihemoprotein reductase
MTTTQTTRGMFSSAPFFSAIACAILILCFLAVLPFVIAPISIAGVLFGLYKKKKMMKKEETTTTTTIKTETKKEISGQKDETTTPTLDKKTVDDATATNELRQRRSANSNSSTSGGHRDNNGETDAMPTTKVALTGSAALMANMRRSAANTMGEKRAKISPSSAGGANGTTTTTTTTSKETDKKSNSSEPACKSEQTFYVLHGGEAAQQVARDIKEAMEEEFLKKRGMKASDVCVMTASMEDFKKTLELYGSSENENNSRKRRAIFVVETVENAQPAEEAGSCIRYFNKLRKKLSAEAEGADKTVLPFDENSFQYAVMGLGDTNLLLDRQTTTAKDCNQAAQTLDNALAALGARRLCEKGLANDAVGLEEGVLPWLEENLLPSAFKAVKEEKERAERDKPIEVVFAYGSQTGNAAEICKNLAAEATEKYKKDKLTTHVECFSCNELDAETSLKPGTVVLFCVSSTGDGDAPDNCDMFLTRLKRRVKKTTASNPVLAGTQYAVLGLGDQNYSAFMAIPRMFSTTMEKGGATAFKKRLEADDTLGLYEQVDAWVDTLWEDLDKAIARAKAARENPKDFLASTSTDTDSKSATTKTKTTAEEAVVPSSYKGIPALQPARVKMSFSKNEPVEKSTSSVELAKDALATRETPFYAKIAAKKILTSTSSDRRVVHLEFDCENKNDSVENYEPGDSLAVLPKNDSALVSELMARLGVVDDAKTFNLEWIEGMAPPGSDVATATKPLPHVITPCTVRDALEKFIDITSIPRKSFLRALAECCTDNAEKDRLLFLSSRDGKERFQAEISEERPTLLTLLRMYPSCSISFERLLDISSPLLPRMYSITSCKDSQKNPSVAFSVVKYEAPESKETRFGVATNWLDRLPVDDDEVKIPIYKVPTKTFGLPEDISKPIIMIGPGTGVAPFRGFLQKREALARADPSLRFAESWLFFGCRRKDEDYLYEADFNAFLENETLTHLVPAFSREDPRGKKVYVQHKLAEREEKMRDLILSEKAYVFVCGDGAHMAKDVHRTLLSIITGGGGEYEKEADAEALLREMTREGRYVRDIWS